MKSEPTTISYPDTLVRMWKCSHNIPVEDFSDAMFGAAFETLSDMLAGHFKNKETPGMHCEQDYRDAANDYLTAMLGGCCPNMISSHTYLLANAKKYLAQKYNPVQYEMNDILQEALLALEKEGKIMRDEASREHHISSKTLFRLKEMPDNAQIATMDDYEARRSAIPSFTTPIRGNNAAQTRMLRPGDAKELVLALLKAFGAWTRKTDLLTTMKNHIPEQMSMVSLSPTGDDPDVNPINGVAAEGSGDFIYDEFQLAQISMVAKSCAERIWTRICKVSDKVFCLYFLPGTYYDTKVSMKDVGNTSTVSDQDKKIRRIFHEEMEEYADYNEVSSPEYIGILATIRKIVELLHKRCTEKKYNPDLSSSEVML